jgi:hypothetical protein
LSQEIREPDAFDLLREIVTLGRNGKPYKHLLPAWKIELDRDKDLAYVIGKALSDVEPKSSHLQES